MSEELQTLIQLKKSEKLIRLAMRKNGPRSYQRGIGALVRLLEGEKSELSRDEIINRLGWSRNNLKNVVKKAQKRGLVVLVEAQDASPYAVQLTKEGAEVLAKRAAANDAAAKKILAGLSEEEIAQLNAITEKLIIAAKAEGVCAFGKGYRFHKGHKGHVPHGENA